MHITVGPRQPELSLFQGHGIEALYGADHVRPFPNKNELKWFRQRSVRFKRHQGDGEDATHHVGICRQARRVREHLVLRDDAHLRIVVLEPRIRILG
jgi:hypothetical protein